MANLYPDKGALDLLNEPAKPVHSFNPLVQISSQIETKVTVEEGSHA
jgi:hypothetical protein